MKKVITILGLLFAGLTGLCQQDSIHLNNSSDTTVTKKSGSHGGCPADDHFHDWHMHMSPWNKNKKPSNITTNWLVVDLGFTNYDDKTNYSGAEAQSFAPGSTKDWFKLRNNKSVDVNIWFFMQRLNVYKHVVNLKYGLGIELNNYRYRDNIKYLANPTEVIMDTIAYTKNKLAADYITVPFMINFNFTPNRENGFGIAFGVSAGYLYSSRQKTISGEFGKKKEFDDFDLNPWKISWIAEVQLGPVKLYGSLATQSMFNKGLDQVPYTFGIRISN